MGGFCCLFTIRAAPRLKDASIREENYPMIYSQIIKILWRMYQKCHLVHADFSEYNLLYHKGVVYVIDVSQSVEHDHVKITDLTK